MSVNRTVVRKRSVWRSLPRVGTPEVCRPPLRATRGSRHRVAEDSVDVDRAHLVGADQPPDGRVVVGAIRSVYARVDVEGPKFVAAHLTPDARELRPTLAPPEEFVMASPAGVRGFRTTFIPILGRDEWLEQEVSA